MIDHPKVVSVVVHYNTPEDCINLLQSLEKVNYTNHRVVVVDNCSQVVAFEKVAEFIASTTESRKIEIIKNISNIGFGGGVNYGFAYANEKYGSNYLHVINTDAEIINYDYVRDLVTILEQQKRIGIIGPAVLKENREELQNTILPFVTLGSAINFRKGYSNLSYIEQVPSVNDVDCVNGVCFIVRSEVFKLIGGFDESYFMYGEEQDLCFAIFKAGYRRVFWSGASIIHYGAEKEGSHEVDWRYINVRKNQVRFLRKYKGISTSLLLASLFSASLIIKYIRERHNFKGQSLNSVVEKMFSPVFSSKR